MLKANNIKKFKAFSHSMWREVHSETGIWEYNILVEKLTKDIRSKVLKYTYVLIQKFQVFNERNDQRYVERCALSYRYSLHGPTIGCF